MNKHGDADVVYVSMTAHRKARCMNYLYWLILCRIEINGTGRHHCGTCSDLFM